jgi:hypothetical protein
MGCTVLLNPEATSVGTRLAVTGRGLRSCVETKEVLPRKGHAWKKPMLSWCKEPRMVHGKYIYS